jgi:ferritin-like metal-binding protein YciE
MADLNKRDAKLVQWLNEAHAKEAELEADLAAHISLTDKKSYKNRLQKHLKETRDHKRRVSSRIKKLGGSATSGPNVRILPDAVGETAGKAMSTVKGGVGTARAAVTNQAETHVRNAQEELREEHVEIAIYTRLEAFADEVGDRETAQLAKSIRRDEERMAKYLDGELKRLVKAAARAEVPADQRPTRSRSRRARRTGGGRQKRTQGRRTSSRSQARSRGTSSRRRAAQSTRRR